MQSRLVVLCSALPTLSRLLPVSASPFHLDPMQCRSCIRLGTIRGDFALAVGRTICHGHDSVDNAEQEITM